MNSGHPIRGAAVVTAALLDETGTTSFAPVVVLQSAANAATRQTRQERAV